MKLYCAHSSAFDFEAEYYRPLQQLAALHGHELVLPHRDRHVTGSSKETIRGCDLVVAEVSFPSTGTGIELGWAEGCGVPILALHRADAAPPGSIGAVTDHVRSYETAQDLVRIVSSFTNSFRA